MVILIHYYAPRGIDLKKMDISGTTDGYIEMFT